MSSIFFINCSKDTNATDVMIRIENIGQEDFINVIVESGLTHDYGDVLAGQRTEYKAFETAYTYAYIEVQIDSSTYIIKPIDYVGETPLEPGNYTYQLASIGNEETYGNLRLTFKKD